MRPFFIVDASHDDDHHRLAKWVPFVGPGAALVLLFVIYVIFADVFTRLVP